jgi:chromosome segregation ATPase
MRKVTVADLQETADVHLGRINDLIRRVAKLEASDKASKAEIAILKTAVASLKESHKDAITLLIALHTIVARMKKQRAPKPRKPIAIEWAKSRGME